jgi:capsular polysaccharide biosynthesis protein
MNDPDHSMAWPGLGDELRDRTWDYDDFTVVEDRPGADLALGLTSLSFIKAALKRRAWLWCGLAIAGLLIGSAAYIKYPPAYQATVSVLLIDSNNQDPAVEILTDSAMAQSTPVAQAALQQLGLNESVASFQDDYQVTNLTDQVLMFTVSAPSSKDAVARANALASSYLSYRASNAQIQQQQQTSELNEQVKQAQQQVNAVNKQITNVSAEPATPAQQSKLTALQKQLTAATDNLAQVQQYVTDTKATTQTSTTAMVDDSKVLDAATPIHHSAVKRAALYVAGGLVGGLAIGMAIVIIAALVSDRLLRRDDVAEALSAPVKLSVGASRASRWLPGALNRRAALSREMTLVASHLRGAVPVVPSGPACLGVVPLDNTRTVAKIVAALATSYAKQGKRVVVADLTGGVAARMLGIKVPGVSPVTRDGADFTLVLPGRDEIAPTGPFQRGMSAVLDGAPPADQADKEKALASAGSDADILLTVATLDPAFGGDHLATWTTDVVAVVTSGKSSAEKVRAVGEMIRLAGARLVSVVLIGADKNDESLGQPRTIDEAASVRPT